ncbi:hypothetical protein NDK25_07460 [Niallia taxi]|nr:hypothetical protein [Niallia taxi]MDE5052249.1 hypothetical protein [Niallia taxi]
MIRDHALKVKRESNEGNGLESFTIGCLIAFEFIFESTFVELLPGD